MKLTAQIKLIISQEDKQSLLETMEQFNEVCNGISRSAFELKIFRQYDIHQMLYHPIRGCFDLSAQLVVRAISKVADSYKLDTKKIRKFREHGAITYDSRILTWKEEEVSIWTIGGRKKFSYICGKRQKEQLKFQKGESDLIYKNGDFFLYTTCEVPEKETASVEQYLGVDLGITNIATDSLEKIYSGSHVNSVRIRSLKLRVKLQAKGTKSAKNLLKKRSKKERRFA